MPNGCMCCRVRGDLVAALKRLIVGAVDVTTLEQADESPAEVVDDRDGASTANPAQINNDQGQRDVVVTGQTPPASVQEAIKPDGVIIECSGLDELAPVLQVGKTRFTYTENGCSSCPALLHAQRCASLGLLA